MATFSYGIQKQYFPVADTDFRIATFGFQDADPGHRYRAIKQEHVLQYVVAGRGRFEVNGKTYAVAAGDLFYLPKNVLVYYCAEPQDPYRYYWVEIDGAAVKQLLERAGLTAETPVAHYADSVIEGLFRNIQPKILENTFAGYLSAKGMVYELLARFLFFREDSSKKLQPPAVQYVEQAILFIKENFNDDIGVAEIAAYVGVGRSYLSVLFSRLTSVSPSEYLISYRIEQAKKMLDLGIPVTETATSCGFNSPAYFSAQFKKRTGKSPSKYRSENGTDEAKPK